VIAMLSKKSIAICGVVMGFFIFCTFAQAETQAKTTDQILTTVDDVLKANPLKAGEEAQTIKIAEGRAMALLIIRVAEGAEFKFLFYLTDDEIVYTIKGEGRILISQKRVVGKKLEKWVELKTGNIYFNSRANVCSIKNTGSGELVIISISSPSSSQLLPILPILHSP